MVPFSLRILQAELPQYMGRPKDALDNLYELQRTCCKVLKNLQDDLTEDGGQGEMTPENRLGKMKTIYFFVRQKVWVQALTGITVCFFFLGQEIIFLQ